MRARALAARRPRTLPASPPPTAYRRALLRLARRDHSAAELRAALLEREHPPAEVEAAIDRLRREGYLDDRGYAARFARARMQHAGLGRLRVRQALRQRGVSRADVDQGLAAALSEVDEAALFERLARRYWHQHARVDPARRLPRLWAFLLRRGFPGDLVRERLHRMWPRWADALEGLEPVDDGEALPAEPRSSEAPGDRAAQHRRQQP